MKNIVMPTPRLSVPLRRIVGVSALLAALSLTAEAEANCTLIAGNVERTPDASLTDNGNGTITDSVTGLMWKKCVEGLSLSGSDCTGTATPLTWSGALERAGSDTTGGSGDWRLPTKNQLLSLVETACRSPAINTSRFPNTQPNYYWSSTPANDFGTSAWYVDFSGDNAARMGIDNKTTTHYARLVRSTIADDGYDLGTPAPNDFSFNSVNNAVAASTQTSNLVTLTGLTGSANLKFACSFAGACTYSIAGGAYVSTTPSTIANQTISLRIVAGAAGSTRIATVTIGGIIRTYSVTVP